MIPTPAAVRRTKFTAAHWVLALALLPLGAAACNEQLLNPMADHRQPRERAFRPSDYYADGLAMRPPPKGTVPRERVTMTLMSDCSSSESCVWASPSAIFWRRTANARGPVSVSSAFVVGVVDMAVLRMLVPKADGRVGRHVILQVHARSPSVLAAKVLPAAGKNRSVAQHGIARFDIAIGFLISTGDTDP